MYHDGIVFPPVRFHTAEGIEELIEAIIANNSRVPEVVLGDLRAQVAPRALGVRDSSRFATNTGATAFSR